jgi:hypothetical protein
MRQHLAIPAALALFCALSLGAGAPKNRDFTGLWKAVDRNDGAERTFCITDEDGDGEYDVAIRDTYWTLCAGDRGVHRATGRVDADGALVVTGPLVCFDTGAELEVTVRLEHSKRTDTMRETALGTTLVSNTLHRVSR